MAGLDSASLERGKRGSGAVDVVDPPAAEPGAVVLLLGQEPVEPAAYVVFVAALGSQRLDGVRGHVRARLVGDLAEVAERQLVEPERLVVGVEGAPAPASRLHPGRPGEPALDGLVAAVAAPQRERDDGGVVDVGIEVVLELEGPAAGREVGPAHRPVALDRDLLGKQPVGCANERRVLRAEAGVAEREDGERRVPDRRLAGLGAQPVALVDREALPALDGLAQGLVLEAVAESDEHQDRPDPRRLDPAPRAVGLLMLPDPAFGFFDRNPPSSRDVRPAAAGGAGADLAQVEVGSAHGLESAADRERDEGAARPAREVVDRERRARREQRELDRDRDDSPPGPLAEEREEALREDSRLQDPALGPDVVARLLARLNSRELERGVGLHRGREIRGPLEPDRPGAVVSLTRQQLVRDLAVEVGRAQGEDVVPEEVLRDHRRVRLELADPPAARVLELEQAAGRALDRLVEPGLDALERDGHAATSSPARTRARAAACPLRTAPSIVGGQPVAVQAPARTTFGRPVSAPRRCASLPGRTAIVACGSRLTLDHISSASPSRSVTAPAIRSTSSRPRRASSSGAPEETTVR